MQVTNPPSPVGARPPNGLCSSGALGGIGGPILSEEFAEQHDAATGAWGFQFGARADRLNLGAALGKLARGLFREI